MAERNAVFEGARRYEGRNGAYMEVCINGEYPTAREAVCAMFNAVHEIKDDLYRQEREQIALDRDRTQ